MKLSELISAFRQASNDEVEPYFWSDSTVVRLLNDAEVEAVIRRRLLHESSRSDFCQINITAGTSEYQLHPLLYELTYLAIEATPGRRTPIRLASAEDLDRIVPDWRERSGPPQYAIQGDTSIRLVPVPNADCILRLEAYRLPIEAMADADDEPEIHSAHHRHLIDWALFKAFSTPDSEAFDPARAASAESGFSAYFGDRPDADLRRSSRIDVPQVVQGFMP